MASHRRLRLNPPKRRYLRAFCQIRLRPYHKVRTKPPSPKIIENSDVLVASKYCVACSRTEINLNKPQSRRFRPFRQMLARCIHIHLRSPLPKIIKNGGFEVASEFNGKKTIKTRQSSEVVLECTTSENNTVFSGIFAVKSSSSLFPFG